MPEKAGTRSSRTLLSLIVMSIPTVYVLSILFFGLTSSVLELGRLLGVPYAKFGYFILTEGWTAAFEYIVFAVFFPVIILLVYSRRGVASFAVALSFLATSAFFFTLDTFNPYGVFIILQAFVPFTASSAASVLNFMGYKTVVIPTFDAVLGPGTTLVAIAQFSMNKVYFPVAIYWPSAGIHSLFIYTIAIVLFMRNSRLALQPTIVEHAVFAKLGMLWKQAPSLLRARPLKVVGKKLARFAVSFIRFTPVYVVVIVGAVGTFTANVLRIATISNIGLHIGAGAARHFHDYWGELFFISWMLIYLMTLFFAPRLISKLSNIRKKRLPDSTSSGSGHL